MENLLSSTIVKMSLPNFLIIGASKCGTTWLTRQLQQHPQVYMPDYEVNYFWKYLDRGIDWYGGHFKTSGDAIAIGESSPNYFALDPKLIQETLPDVKLIVMLRDPIKRLISDLNHMMRYGEISPLCNIDNFLLNGEKRLLDQHEGLSSKVVDRSRYYRYVKPYRDSFNADRLLILIYEDDVVAYPQLGLKKVCDFLGIDSGFQFTQTNKPVNSHSQDSRLTIILRYYFPLLRPFLSRNMVRRHMPGPRNPVSPSKHVIKNLYLNYDDDTDKLFSLIGKERGIYWSFSE